MKFWSSRFHFSYNKVWVYVEVIAYFNTYTCLCVYACILRSHVHVHLDGGREGVREGGSEGGRDKREGREGVREGGRDKREGRSEGGKE